MTTYDIFDGHCDTIYELFSKNQEENLIKNKLHFNVYDTKDYNRYIQVLAMWADPHYKGREAKIFMENLVRRAVSHLKKCDLDIIKTKNDLESTGNFGVILGIEGADAIWSIDDLIYYYDKGIRIITLTWNGSNLIGNGALSEKNEGLTDFGKEVLLKMNELGIAVDLSHLNEEGFFDSISLSQKPVIVSHSNARYLCSHKRNLSDEQFRALIENKGVCGINFCCDFLSDDGEADISKIIAHIEHFCSLGGELNIGLGSDFDGIPVLPSGITSNKDLKLILNELLKLNYSEEQVKNVAFNNFFRVFSEILG